MKYIKLFDIDSDRVSYEDSENYIEPYVSYVDGDNTVHYGGGDTPEETPVKVAAESSGQYWIGKYEKLPSSSPIVLMGCDMNTSNLTLVSSTGTVLASGANPINLVEERIKSQMAAAGKSVEEVQVWHIEVTSGSQIENWDTYQEIPAI